MIKALLEPKICFIEINTITQECEEALRNHDSPLYIVVDFNILRLTRILVNSSALFSIMSLTTIIYF